MLEVNYKWQINKSGEIFTFDETLKNKFINSNSRIFEIRAANGQGKSFLIDLISFALELQNTDKISSQIKDKINRLGKEKNDLSYNIKLDLPDGRIVSLEKTIDQKKSTITLYNKDENIKNYGIKNLQSELEILYDIPQDPLSRLNLILRDINNYSRTFKDYFSNIHSSLEKLTIKANNTRDESKINFFKEEIAKYEKLVSNETQAKDNVQLLSKNISLQQLLDNLLNQIISRKEFLKTKEANQKLYDDFNNLDNKKSISESKITQISSDIRTAKFNLNTLVSDNYSKKFTKFFEITSKEYLKDIKKGNENFSDRINKIQAIYQEALDDQAKFSLLKEEIYQACKIITQFYEQAENKDLSKLKESILELQHIIDDIFHDKSKSDLIDKILDINIPDIKNKIDNKLDELSNNEYLKDFEFIESFQENLVDFVNNNYLKEQKNISKKTSELKQLQSSLENSIDERLLNGFTEYTRSEKALKDLRTEIDQKIKSILEYNPSEIYEVADFLQQLKSEKYVRELNIIYLTNIKKQIRELNLDENTPINILNNNLEILITTKKETIADFEFKLQKNSIELAKEKEKPDQTLNNYQKIYLQKIYTFFETLKKIPSQISGQIVFDENGELIKNKENLDVIEKGFLKIAGTLISKSLDNKILWKGSEFLTLETFDIINGQFVTLDGARIEKSDFSVGQSSTIYLLQKIRNLNDKYHIILLDEIAQIDSVNKNLIIEEIKKIKDSNHLVLAILIRPSEEGNSGFELTEIA